MTTATTTTEPGPEAAASGLDRYFSITQRGSSVQRELRGGLTTFFTMAYIVVLNPLIIGTVKDSGGHFLGGSADSAIPRVAAATAFVAAVMTLLMGIVGRYPFALATGLGLNAFVAFSLASQMSWQDAMGLVVLEGVVITVLVLTGVRGAIFRAIPAELKTAISVGIGLFIAIIGFVDAGFVRRIPDAAGTTVPVQLGSTGQLRGWPTVVFVVGLLIMIVLVVRKVKGALLIGIIVTTVFAIIIQQVFDVGGAFTAAGKPNPTGFSLNVPRIPDSFASLPDLHLLGRFSLLGGFKAVGGVAAVLFVFTLMLADFFDTMGTVVGVGAEAGLLDDEGQLPGADRVLLVDSIAAMAGGATSTSSSTTYIESAAGVGDGARTGLASVVTGLLFVVALFLTPLVEVVPFEAASPALVVVGFLLLTQIRNIDFEDWTIAIPAFLTIVLMPFTYSITNGIGAGFVSYAVLRLTTGRVRGVHPLLWVVSALFVVYFAIDPLQRALA